MCFSFKLSQTYVFFKNLLLYLRKIHILNVLLIHSFPLIYQGCVWVCVCVCVGGCRVGECMCMFCFSFSGNISYQVLIDFYNKGPTCTIFAVLVPYIHNNQSTTTKMSL